MAANFSTAEKAPRAGVETDSAPGEGRRDGTSDGGRFFVQRTETITNVEVMSCFIAMALDVASAIIADDERA